MPKGPVKRTQSKLLNSLPKRNQNKIEGEKIGSKSDEVSECSDTRESQGVSEASGKRRRREEHHDNVEEAHQHSHNDRKAFHLSAGFDDSEAESLEGQSQDGNASQCEFEDFEVDRETTEKAEGPIARRRIRTKIAASETGYTNRPLLKRTGIQNCQG